MTDKAQFRIGGVYRQRDGRLARLCPPIVIDPQGRALVHATCYRSGLGIGHRLAQTGMEWDQAMLEHARDLLPGELHQKGGKWVPVEEEKKKPESLGAILRRAQESLTASATPTIDKLENERDPQRPPLPYFTERPKFDPFPGFITKTSTTEQPRQSFLCDSPDLLPASHQVVPSFGSASLKG